MGGIMASSPELMQTVQKFQEGGSVSPYFGRMTQQNLPAIRPGSFAAQPITSIQDFISRANRESGIGQIQQANEMARAGVTPEDMARVQAATEANRTANRTDAQIAASQSPTLRGPTASQAQMGQNINMFENMMDAGSIPTLRGPTAEDVSAELNSASSERIINDRRERIGPSEMPQGPAADVAETKRLADSIFGDSLSLTTPKVVEDVTEDADLAEDSPATSATEGTDPGTAVREVSAIAEADIPEEKKGAVVSDVLKSVLSSDENPVDVNNLILEMSDKKDPEKKISRKERIEKNVELYNEMFGVDPEKNMKEDGFNLAYLGFAIASGDSPNALQNIARGSMQGLKKISETKKARQEREDRAKMFGLKQALKEEDDIKKEEQRMFEMKFGAGLQLARDRFKSDQELRKWAGTQVLAERRLDREIAARIELQDQKDLSRAEQNRLDRESAELRAIRAQLPEAANLWLEMNPKVDITTEEGQKAALDGMVSVAGRLGTEELGTRKSMSDPDRQYNARTEVLDRDKITPGVYVDETGNFTQAGVTLYNNLLKGPAGSQTTPPAADGAGATQRITLEPDAE